LTLLPAQQEAKPITLNLGNNVVMELDEIAKGSFRQGSPAEEKNRGPEETLRQVTLSRDFYLGRYPVTVGQFRQFVSETSYRTEAETAAAGGLGFDGEQLVQRKDFTWKSPGFPQTDDHPVCLVTWNDAQEFLRWLSRKTGRACTLPSEAQWEYACRAGAATPFYNGATETDLADMAWYKTNAGKGTQPAGRKKPNAWGLYDMNGNVRQWCQDLFSPYAPLPVTDPIMLQVPSGDRPRRVLRGGSWMRDAAGCRSASRYRSDPGRATAENGFRVLILADAPPIPAERKLPALPGDQSRIDPTVPPSPAEVEATSNFSLTKLGTCLLALAVPMVALVIVVLFIRRIQNKSAP
jgi:formylglycine-generating enzyme required for sulfatase activity